MHNICLKIVGLVLDVSFPFKNGPFSGREFLFILDLTELIGSRGLDISPTLPFDIDATALQEATWGGIGGNNMSPKGLNW